MQKHDSQTGSAHIVIVVALVLALVGGLGYVFWDNILNKKEAAVAQVTTKPTAKVFCSDGENTAAEKGVFCSEEVGVRFTVPTILTNKVAKSRDYPVHKGPLDYNARQDAGMSELVYAASVTGNDNFVFTIAQEPLRTGYLDVYQGLQNVYFDEQTTEFSLVNMPTRTYDSATDSYTQQGGYSIGEVLPSFKVDSLKFYKGAGGDAGMIHNVYLAVINKKIIKIQLVHSERLGGPEANNPTTIDADKVFAELEQGVKSLKVNKS
jgi:flagellar basal body-associated protein FliL